MWSLADKYKAYLTPCRAAEQLMEKLKPYGPWIYHVSKNRCSVYIHFNNLPNRINHKLRVSDHNEQEKYGYKWQLRLDGHGKWINRKEHSRYYINVDDLVKSFKGYYERAEALNQELMAHAAGSAETTGGETWPRYR